MAVTEARVQRAACTGTAVFSSSPSTECMCENNKVHSSLAEQLPSSSQPSSSIRSPSPPCVALSG